jgi:regulator of RNase E activity RraA
MSDNVKKIVNDGNGVMVLSRKEAGEAYKAFKRVKAYEVSYWTKNRKKKESK